MAGLHLRLSVKDPLELPDFLLHLGLHRLRRWPVVVSPLGLGLDFPVCLALEDLGHRLRDVFQLVRHGLQHLFQ